MGFVDRVILAAFCLCYIPLPASAQVRVVLPKSLVKKIGRQPIHGSTATFGAPFYGDRVLGRLVWSESAGKNYCKDDDYKAPSPDSYTGQLIDIMLVRRGDCPFVEKVRIAQGKGAHAVIIVDGAHSKINEGNIHQVIVSDEGKAEAAGISIPSVLIPYEQGEQLIEAANLTHVVVELKWDIPTTDVVIMDLWMSSGSLASMSFLSAFAEKRLKLNRVVKFQPHYSVLSLPASSWAEIDQDDCIIGPKGEYCAEAPAGEGNISGRDVLEEDVRQLCIHKMTKVPRSSWPAPGSKGVAYAEKYWDYVVKFAEQCLVDALDKKTRFGLECSERIMKSVGLDVKEVGECAANEKLSLLDTERENKAWSPRALRINGWRYTGMMDADLVTRAICSGFSKQPQECVDLRQPRNPFEKYGGVNVSAMTSRGSDGGFSTFMFGLSVVILACVSGIMYKRSLRSSLHRAVREEVMLEVQTQMAQYRKM